MLLMLILMFLSHNSAVDALDCDDFSLFDLPQWRNFAQDIRLSQEGDGDGTGRYMIRLEMPSTLKRYLEGDDSDCLSQRFIDLEFEIHVGMDVDKSFGLEASRTVHTWAILCIYVKKRLALNK